MARVALDKPDRAARLATWRDQPGVLGVRLNFGADEAAWLTDGTADWFWPAAEKARLPVMFLTSGQTSLFAGIAERHPELTLILDHMGVGAGLRPRADSSGSASNNVVAEAIAQAAALAKYPNVSVKLSSVPLISTEPYPFRDAIPHIHRLFDAYGPERCHFGTDLTNSFARATYRQRVTQFTEELPFLTESDKDWIMGRAILARLRWT
jgi:predicted TIM-barrel fold metal-dependent hydrolase